ncbi:hypothetical protein SAMN05518871_11052 [Psychrobacillus sp. OK028]|uniref:hypothetical protein n=1 Tax=Psychrobacillus sp. OK028 TaxID=1884359 RepID=UPI000881F46F|nr:hypothetical protein [Psychrobacillus sp. OK028]SDO09618.1 hypothetical protein SAMN05518871_11052 [Psychrobacillus sp. OK028]
MNNYIPNQVKDLSTSKQRVMENVVDEVENTSRRSKYKWRYLVITAVLAITAMLFVYNEILIENEQQALSEMQLDFTKPTLSEEQGLLYLHGVTLGDSQSKVIERLGVNYKVDDYEDGSGADFILDYGGIARFYFYQDKLDSIIFMKVDKTYFDKLFNDYNGFKFLTPTTGDDRYFYSKETGQLLKATIVPDGNLYLYLMRGGKDLLENPDFPKIEQILN